MTKETTREAQRLAEVAYQRLLSRILTTEMPGGTVIQERKLAASLDISRTPMREALGRLEGEGLLKRLTDRLVSVRVISLSDYLHALHVRALLEPAAAGLAAKNITSGDVATLTIALDALVADPSADQHWSFDDLLHSTISLRSENPFLAQSISEMRRYTTIFERQTVPVRISPGMDDHRLIIAELAAGRADRAREAMAAHLKNIRRRVLDDL